jgi:lipoprotein-anchoring transpeptidase ErfK/SrfK
MTRASLAILLILLAPTLAHAQYWGQPYPGYSMRPYPGYYMRPYPGYYGSAPYWGGRGWGEDEASPYRTPLVQSGGERPAIAALTPRMIAFPSSFPVHSIVIDTHGRQLFLVQSASEALYYPISVGREGFAWTGREAIARKAEWPDWYPPEEMRERDYRLPEKMTGGIRNPLGAMALYLGNTLYRIHGTNDAKSIGRAASSGCFRMLNGYIVDLASRVEIGTVVTVVGRLPPQLDRIVVDQVHPQRPAASQGERRL